MNFRILGLLSLGHLVNDINQGALPALLPFLIAEHGFSYSTAATVMFAFTMTSTIIQPLLGHLADRCNKSWLIPTGLLMAGGGLAVCGLASSYILLILAVTISGIGSAAFHPEAARHVDMYGGNQKATAMSVFGVGGNLGFTLGPLLMTGAVLYMGLKGTLIMIIPVAVVAVLSFIQFSHPSTYETSQRTAEIPKKSKDDWGAFTRLTITIIGKSILFYALLTFIPIYWTTELKQTEFAGGVALSLFSFASIIGNLLGGRLADRFGCKTIVVAGCTLLIPVIPALILTHNVYLATLFLAFAGALLLLTYGPTVVMGQQYIPNHVGLSSGMTIGVAFSVGGTITPLIGMLADAHGVGTALCSIIIVPLIITATSLTLKPLNSENVFHHHSQKAEPVNR